MIVWLTWSKETMLWVCSYFNCPCLKSALRNFRQVVERVFILMHYRFCRSVAGPIPPTQWQVRHAAGRDLRRPTAAGGQFVARSDNALRRGTEATHLHEHRFWSVADESCCTLVILLLDQDAEVAHSGSSNMLGVLELGWSLNVRSSSFRISREHSTNVSSECSLNVRWAFGTRSRDKHFCTLN